MSCVSVTSKRSCSNRKVWPQALWNLRGVNFEVIFWSVLCWLKFLFYDVESLEIFKQKLSKILRLQWWNLFFSTIRVSCLVKFAYSSRRSRLRNTSRFTSIGINNTALQIRKEWTRLVIVAERNWFDVQSEGAAFSAVIIARHFTIDRI